MQNKLFKRVLTGVLSSALVFATAIPAQGALVPTEGKKKVVKSMAITNLKSDGTIVDVAKNDEVKVTFPSNAKDANYVAAAAFGITLEGKGAAKGAVVKCDGKKIENGVDAFAITQLAAGEAQTNKIQVISKAKTKKGKKLKVPFTVTFEADTSWVTVTDFSASISPAAIKVGDTATISYTTTPADATIDVDYLSSDEAIATVDEKGVVTGVAAGDATITVIPDGNLDLAKDVTVKVTEEEPEPVEPEELALDRVEGAQRNTNGQTNIVIAYFSAPVDAFAETDVQIRRVSDDRLWTVEDVVLSTDKKSATLTLTGTSSAGTSAQFLESNVDYKLSVNIGGKTYEKAFSIPAVDDEDIVTGADAAKGKVTTYAGTYTDVDGLVEDFYEILGRQVTIEFNKNNEITKFSLLDENVIYGAFKYNAASGSKSANIENKATGDKYDIQGSYVSTSIYGSNEGCLDEDGVLAGNDVDYAKVTLNANGTVRYISSIQDFNNVIYVKEVKDTDLVMIDSKTQSLKDYTIVKDGKTISIDAIESGDVVFVDTTADFAVVYSETVSGKLSVYTDKFAIGTTKYDNNGNTSLNAAGAVKNNAADSDLEAYEGKEVVGYLNFAGAVVVIVPAEEAVADTSLQGVTTKDTIVYMNGSTTLFDIFLDSGDGQKKFTVDASKLKKVVTAANGTKYEVDGTTVKGFKVSGTTLGSNIYTVEVDGGTQNGQTAITGNTDLVEGKLVTLTQNTEGVVTGIILAQEGQKDYILDDTAANDTFTQIGDTPGHVKKGAKTVTGQTAITDDTTAVISATTPVYVWNSDTHKVKKYEYGSIDFDADLSKNDHGVSGDFSKIRLTDKNTVDAIIIDSEDLEISIADTEDIKGVIVSATFSSGATKNLKELVVDYNGEEKTYTTFSKDIADSTLFAGADYDDWAAGTVATVTLVKGTETVDSVAAETKQENVVFGNDSQNKGKYVIDGTYELITAIDSTQPVTIVTVDGDKKVKNITWSQYCDQKVTDVESVEVFDYDNSGKYIDTIVVWLGSSGNTPTASGDVTFISDKGGVNVNGDGEYLASSASTTLTATLEATGAVASSYQWYVVEGNASPVAVTTGGNARKLTLANADADVVTAPAATAGNGFYVVITDTEGVPHESAKVWLQAPVPTTATFTGSAHSNAISDSGSVVGTLAVKDQFDQSILANTAFASGATVTVNSTNIDATEGTISGSVATNGEVTLTTDTVSGDAIVATDSVTLTVTGPTAVSYDYNFTITAGATDWSAGDITVSEHTAP